MQDEEKPLRAKQRRFRRIGLLLIGAVIGCAAGLYSQARHRSGKT